MDMQVNSQYNIVHNNAADMGDYKENNGLLSTMRMASVGYRVGTLNSDGDEKSKRDDSSGSEHSGSRGETVHWVSGVDGDGELVSDGRGDGWNGRSKLKKFSHEVDNGRSSVWLGVSKSESGHAFGRSGSSGRLSPPSGSATSERFG